MALMAGQGPGFAGRLYDALGLGGPSFYNRLEDYTQRQQQRIRRGEGPPRELSPEAVDLFGALGPADLSPWGALGLGGIIRAYHGTPAAPFEKFADKFIGSGEGAQMYGQGHYLAELAGVGEDYRRTLATPRLMIDDELANPLNSLGRKANQIAQGLDPGAKIGELDSFISTLEGNIKNAENQGRPLASNYYGRLADARRERAEYAGLQGRNVRFEENPGTLMTVDIDVEPEQLLDYDLPLSQQPAGVRQILEEKLGIRAPKVGAFEPFEKIPGAQRVLDEQGVSQGMVYPLESGGYKAIGPNKPMQAGSLEEAKRMVMQDIDATGADIYRMVDPENQVAASKKLREAGIPGLRYLDAQSRAAGQGTRNFVMFDPELLRIIEAQVGGLAAKKK